MNLNAPKQIVFIIACVLALVGILSGFGIFTAPIMPAFSWVATGFVLLAAGNILKGF